jgi:hypothetical protein
MKQKNRANDWSGKVLALVKAGNTDAALAQIKVAPSVKDLQQLRKTLPAGDVTTRSGNLGAAIDEHIALLTAPRLHRSP